MTTTTPLRQWTPIRSLAARPEIEAGAMRMVEEARADLTSGDYRWKSATGFLDRVLVLHAGAQIFAVAAHYLEHNDDLEVAAAAGEVAIRVPLLVCATSLTPSSLLALVEILRRQHGDHRISLTLPVMDDRSRAALVETGFRMDSAMSVNRSMSFEPDLVTQLRIRPAARADADAADHLFTRSLETLAAVSPFVMFNPAAALSVRHRIAGCADGLTENGTRVWMAEDALSTVVGIVEAHVDTSPDDYAILHTPLGVAVCIDWIAVAPDQRGSGIGRALVSHVLGELATDGTTMAYTYHLLGEGSAARFWSRCGFTPNWTTWELFSSDALDVS